MNKVLAKIRLTVCLLQIYSALSTNYQFSVVQILHLSFTYVIISYNIVEIKVKSPKTGWLLTKVKAMLHLGWWNGD
jgi:hypothetical protein